MATYCDAYSEFAAVYDTFMDETPYEEWLAYIRRILVQENINDGLLLDLGCGTGKMTRLLAEAGYDMIGVDNSYDMLGIAMEQGPAEILYLCQDMRAFELYGTVRAVVSVCDCLNYILDPEELTKVFQLVNNYLDPKGIFIFDFNTEYKYRDVIGETTIAENREDCSFIWDNFYDEETKINTYEVTVFQKVNSSKEELFTRFMEEHNQRSYSLEEMKRILEKAGMLYVDAFDTDTGKAVTNESGRITVICREQGK